MNYTLANYYEEAGISPNPKWASEIVLEDPDTGEGLRPMWHQITGLKLSLTTLNARSGLWDDMGTGKTLISQAYAIWHAGSGNKVIAVMPGILLGQYKQTLLKTFKGVEDKLSVEIYHGTVAKKNKQVDRWIDTEYPDIVLTTYDTFRTYYMLFLEYSAAVFDECKQLANPENMTYLGVTTWAEGLGSKSILLLNGTPGKNSLLDLYGYIKLINPSVYSCRGDFDQQHVEYTKIPTTFRGKNGALCTRGQETVLGFRSLDKLYSNLYLQSRRVEKADVLDLPQKRIVQIQFDLNPAHKKQYDKLVLERMLLLPDNQVIDITASSSVRNTCMQLVANPEAAGIKEESALFSAIDELLDEMDLTKTKVFLLAHYRATVEKVGKRYAQHQPALIYGGSNAEKEKDRFLTDPKCRMAVANYQSGGVGLNLQSVCHTVITVEPTQVPGEFQQAVDRVDRKGQKNKVTVYVLVAKGTIYAKTVVNMRRKEGEILQVVSKGKLQAELLGQDD